MNLHPCATTPLSTAQTELTVFCNNLANRIQTAVFTEPGVQTYWNATGSIATKNLNHLITTGKNLSITNAEQLEDFRDALWRANHFLNSAEGELSVAHWLARASRITVNRLILLDLLHPIALIGGGGSPRVGATKEL